MNLFNSKESSENFKPSWTLSAGRNQGEPQIHKKYIYFCSSQLQIKYCIWVLDWLPPTPLFQPLPTWDKCNNIETFPHALAITVSYWAGLLPLFNLLLSHQIHFQSILQGLHCVIDYFGLSVGKIFHLSKQCQAIYSVDIHIENWIRS